MTSHVPAYRHTQHSPLAWLLAACALPFPALYWLDSSGALDLPSPGAGLFVLPCVAIGIVALSFHHLTVADAGDGLSIRFGPLPLFRRKVLYEDIESVDVGRTLVIEGWGIHYSLRGGWIWNLWGRDCVVLHLRKGTLRIGTDDAENLAEFLSAMRSPR